MEKLVQDLVFRTFRRKPEAPKSLAKLFAKAIEVWGNLGTSNEPEPELEKVGQQLTYALILVLAAEFYLHILSI